MAASYYPAVRYGGLIVSVHGLCKALAARGHEVHVFTTSVDGPVDSDVPLSQPVEIDGVRVWYFRSQRLRKLYWSPPMARALVGHIGTFDVVHLHALFVWPVWAAARAARRAGVPYLVAPRGMLEQALIRKKNRLMKSVLLAGVGRPMLEGAAGIHVTSAREAAEALAFGFTLPPIHEVPNGVDMLDEPGTPQAVSQPVAVILGGAPFVLFIGRISWKKGLDRLIKAMTSVANVRLVVAGPDEEGYRQTLEAQVGVAGLGSRVVWAGSVHGADKAALLAHAKVLILPSYSENFGNVVLEAMAAGCPVVVTPEVGVAGLVRESQAGCVIDGDPVVFGSALAELLADAPLRQAMGERGRMTAREYGWPKMAERMERVYKKVLTRPLRSPTSSPFGRS